MLLSSSAPQKPSAQTVNWKIVDQLLEQDLPESALKELAKYEVKLNKSGNMQEIIKAQLYKSKIRMDINPHQAAESLKEIEEFTNSLDKSAEQQLMFCTLAEFYLTHYQNNKYNIDKRTNIPGELPENIETWTQNHYLQKINSLFDITLKDKGLTQKTELKELKDLLVSFNEEINKTPSLYDYLLYKKIEILNEFDDTSSIKACYQELINFRKSQDNTVLSVVAELEYLKFQHQNSDLYIIQLDNLAKTYKDSPAIVEIYAEQANYYLRLTELANHKKLAHNICKKGIKNYPSYQRIGILQNIKKQIEEKELNLIGKPQIKAFSEFEIELETKNIDELNLELYKVNLPATDFFLYNLNKRINPKNELNNKELVEKNTIRIKTNKNFEKTTTKHSLTNLDYGIYEIRVYDPKAEDDSDKTAVLHFVTTDLTYIKKDISNKETAYYIVNRITGKRLKNVELSVYEYKYNIDKYDLQHIETHKTDSKGKIILSRKAPYTEILIQLKNKDDKYFYASTYTSFQADINYNEKAQENIDIFTDRSIYRPGQTLYFKAIAYSLSKKTDKVLTNKKITIDLIDVNGKTVQTKELTSNEFGSVSGEFILPSSGLNGYYTIRANRQFSNRFRIEEYKRPTFEVLIEQPKDEVKFDKEVQLEGEVKAYSGHGIANAKVKYTIHKQSHPFWRWYIPIRSEVLVESGTIDTDENGNFKINFIPKKDEKITNLSFKQINYFNISIEATDIKGETQQGKINIAVGEQSLFIIADIPQRINKDITSSFKISTQTLNREEISKNIKYQIYSIKTTTDYAENIINHEVYKEDALVQEANFNTANEKLTLDFSSYHSGRYKIKLTTEESDGEKVESEYYFVVYGAKDKSPAVKTYTWVLNKNIECEVGEKAEILFGTSVKNAEVLMELIYKNQILSSKWIKFNNSIRKYNILLSPKYRDGLTVNFTFVQDEKLFTESIKITEKKAAKRLSPSLIVFRNKLKPGEHAEWTLNVPEVSENDKIVEMLASMYDASLDNFEPHQWRFNPLHTPYYPYISNWTAYLKSKEYKYIRFSTEYVDVPSFYTPQSNKFGLFETYHYTNYRHFQIRGKRAALMQSTTDQGMGQSAIVSKESSPNVKEESFDSEDFHQEKITSPNIRENFNETAFFFPHLYTDNTGNVKIKFNMPESLTKWKFSALAHTKDLFYGLYETDITTEQDLMIQLNMPRFVRESDMVQLTANLTNLSDRDLNASVQLLISDPKTEQVVLLNDTNMLQVNIKAGASLPISWKVKGFNQTNLYTCKVTASTADFTDGEQHYLPVLPDKVLVTESYPISIKGDEPQTFQFDKINELIDSVDTQNLNLEFTANPIWYAIQALPTLSSPQYDNAIDYFTAYYVNSLAGKIIADHPKIKAVFEDWEASKTTNIRSALQENQALKQVLIEESPWLSTAEKETERQARIALLFDINQQSQQKQLWLNKLSSLQLNNGAFTWFEGMKESRWITQNIVDGLIKLQKLNLDSKSIDSMLQQAIIYLDGQMNKDYLFIKNNIKNYQTKQTISANQLYYLSLRSQVLNIELNENIIEAYIYFLEQVKQYHNKFNLHNKALAAITLHYNDNLDIRDKVLQSLNENALKTDEMGMFWAKNTAGYFWNQRPVSVHTKLMEAFNLSNDYTNELEEMKVWLIRQKQTQIWDTPISSVDAIHTLITTGIDLLKSPVHYNISAKDKKFSTKEGISGSGYLQKNLQAEDIKDGIKIQTSDISIKELESPRAWGSLYWQYYRNMDEVRSSANALQISKQLFVEKVTNDTKLMLPLNAKDKDYMQIVKTGDKIIVRLTISTDRDLEFVSLKDNRASNLEPLIQTSSTYWRDNLMYYRSIKDVSTLYFFNELRKGTYILEDEYFVNNSGEFSGGTAEIQCLYAPEYKSISSGERINVE